MQKYGCIQSMGFYMEKVDLLVRSVDDHSGIPGI